MDSKTLSYILKRIVMAVFTLWAVITITFFVMHAVPGGPFTREKAISAEAQAAHVVRETLPGIAPDARICLDLADGGGFTLTFWPVAGT